MTPPIKTPLKMGSTFRFIEQPSEHSLVLEWFRQLPTPPMEIATSRAIVLHFPDCGPLVYRQNGEIDAKASPVATFFAPRIVRGALWSVGDVHFLATPMSTRFPGLKRVSSQLSRWLSRFENVYSNKLAETGYGYYLEGSVKEQDGTVYALPSGLDGLRSSRYFVSESESQTRLDDICRRLRLRGVECSGT